MAGKPTAAEPAWNEQEYQVTVNSVAGRYLGGIVHADEVEDLFYDESNVKRLIALGAITPYNGEDQLPSAAHAIEGSAAGIAPGTIVQAPLTAEEMAGMSREELAARGIVVQNKAPIVEPNTATVQQADTTASTQTSG